MKNNKIFDACNIYILLWVAGHVQGMFLTSSLVSLLFYIPFAAMTVYYIVKTITSFNPKGVMKVLCVFFAVLVMYGVFLLLLDNARGQDRKSFLMMLISSLGPVFPFYVFSKQGKLTEKRMLFWFFVFIVVATLDFEVYRRKSILLLTTRDRMVEEITNNTAYHFAALLPFVFMLHKRKMVQYVSMAYLLYFVVVGMKRGAVLVSALLFLWFVYVSLKNSHGFKKTAILLLSIVLVSIGVKFIGYFYENSDYFQQRIESTVEGKSSGRDFVYSELWNHYLNNDNVLQLLFGEGAYHTENVTGHLKAHNDWLELLIDCGLLGVILYFVYWIAFVKDWRRCRNNVMIYAMMGSCFIFTFCRTFFSMSFSDMPFYISMIMGYCFSKVGFSNEME
ncbi:MAG: O-antigen ligase family protein [Bacteroidia bacterium]|nr:O-antigen ligase family protein [Bacteroidia bacterium]